MARQPRQRKAWQPRSGDFWLGRVRQCWVRRDKAGYSWSGGTSPSVFRLGMSGRDEAGMVRRYLVRPGEI
jgi:hypothetical protein